MSETLRPDLIVEIRALVHAFYKGYDSKAWKKAQRINRKGGPHLGKRKWIKAVVVITGVGCCFKGSDKIFLASDGQLYVYDRRSKYVVVSYTERSDEELRLLYDEFRKKFSQPIRQ